jgi:hypothetical protein
MKKPSIKNTFISAQNGFGHIEVFTLIIVVIIVGLIGVKVIEGSHAATPSSTLFGTTISSASDLSTKTAQFGHMQIVRVYYPGLPDPDAWSSGLVSLNHSAVNVSFKALPKTILSGADDQALSHFFDTAPTNYPIYYTYYHEPEDNIADGQFTATDYKAAWAHIVTLANQAHNPNLVPTLVLMGWTLDPASHRTWTDYVPSGHIIKVLGWDDYPSGGVGFPDPSYLQEAIDTSKGAGYEYAFPEFGTTTVAGRGAWLTTMGDFLEKSGAVYATLYDSPIAGGLGGGGSFYISDASSINAWKAIVQSSSTPQAPAPQPQPQAPAVPTVSVSTPANGATLSGVVNITGTEQNITSMYYVALRVDNKFVEGNYNGTLSFPLNTKTLSKGTHTLIIRVWNNANKDFDSQPVTFKVSN